MKIDKLSLKTKLLKDIFDFAPKRFREEELDHHPLVKKYHLTSKELKDNIDFLVETGFIQRFPGKSYKEDRIFEWLIMDKGLHYLENKEAEKSQEKTNRIIAFTGGIIALTTIYSFIVQSINLKDYPKTYWIITPIFLILILFCLGPLIRFIVYYWKEEVFVK